MCKLVTLQRGDGQRHNHILRRRSDAGALGGEREDILPGLDGDLRRLCAHHPAVVGLYKLNAVGP
jgi:hypothetical protein